MAGSLFGRPIVYTDDLGIDGLKETGEIILGSMDEYFADFEAVAGTDISAGVKCVIGESCAGMVVFPAEYAPEGVATFISKADRKAGDRIVLRGESTGEYADVTA